LGSRLGQLDARLDSPSGLASYCPERSETVQSHARSWVVVEREIGRRVGRVQNEVTRSTGTAREKDFVADDSLLFGEYAWVSGEVPPGWGVG